METSKMNRISFGTLLATMLVVCLLLLPSLAVAQSSVGMLKTAPLVSMRAEPSISPVAAEPSAYVFMTGMTTDPGTLGMSKTRTNKKRI